MRNAIFLAVAATLTIAQFKLEQFGIIASLNGAEFVCCRLGACYGNKISEKRAMKRALIFFAAGCLGALVNSLVVWLFGEIGINKLFGVSIAPALTASWLYPRIVWGGIWGFLFFFPLLDSKPFSKGAVLSLFPTMVQLFIVFPFKVKKGVAGIELGVLTPVLVFVFNWVWGVVTSLTISYSK
jgi:hypothetical protein